MQDILDIWAFAAKSLAQIADDRGHRETARLIRERKPTDDEIDEMVGLLIQPKEPPKG